jgi:hypothetical protein
MNEVLVHSDPRSRKFRILASLDLDLADHNISALILNLNLEQFGWDSADEAQWCVEIRGSRSHRNGNPFRSEMGKLFWLHWL